ncbi:MAG: hypothetical protein P8J77_00925 [Flavobacteriales bacterium]|nr:hypothetical protein [Flavobacteriales bacterium]
MKKLFTMLTVVAISTTMSFAQSGTFALGVGSDMAGKSWQNYSINPTVGYFVSDKLLVGTGLSMDIEGETMDFSPYARYYLGSAIYAMVGVKLTDDATDIDAGCGLSLMWNDKVAIEPGFGVSIGEDKLKLALTIGISLRLEMNE